MLHGIYQTIQRIETTSFMPEMCRRRDPLKIHRSLIEYPWTTLDQLSRLRAPRASRLLFSQALQPRPPLFQMIGSSIFWEVIIQTQLILLIQALSMPPYPELIPLVPKAAYTVFYHLIRKHRIAQTPCQLRSALVLFIEISALTTIHLDQ